MWPRAASWIPMAFAQQVWTAEPSKPRAHLHKYKMIKVMMTMMMMIINGNEEQQFAVICLWNKEAGVRWRVSQDWNRADHTVRLVEFWFCLPSSPDVAKVLSFGLAHHITFRDSPKSDWSSSSTSQRCGGMKGRSAEHEGDFSARNRSPVWLSSHFQPAGEIPKKLATTLHQDVHDLTGQDTDWLIICIYKWGGSFGLRQGLDVLFYTFVSIDT